MAEPFAPGSKVAVGMFCAVACIGAAAIYLWGYSNEQFSRESWFWAAPLLSPVPYLLVLRWKRLGSITMFFLYSAAYAGALRMIQLDCARQNCPTHNVILTVAAPMIAGLHIICMLFALIWMCVEAWRVRPVT